MVTCLVDYQLLLINQCKIKKKKRRKLKIEKKSYRSARQQQTVHLSQGVWLHKGPMKAEQIDAFTRRASLTSTMFPRRLGLTYFYIISILRMG